MELELVGIDFEDGDAVDVYFNRNKTLTIDTVGHTNIVSFTIEFKRLGAEVVYTFPTTYNIGAALLTKRCKKPPSWLDAWPEQPWGETDCQSGIPIAADPPVATKTVQIRVSKASARGMYVDYLFEAADFMLPEKYFVYDPAITVGPASSPNSQRQNNSTNATTAAPTTTPLVAKLPKAGAALAGSSALAMFALVAALFA